MSRGADIFLLTIRGTTKLANAVEARATHNATAGSDAGVAAARSLGDLSHKVFVAAAGAGEMAGAKANELLFMDLWNDVEGLGQFFGNKQVQEQGGQIFAGKDPTVWMRAEGSFSFNLPAAAGHHDRYVGLIRGPVKSRDHAKEAFRAAGVKGVNEARRLGQLSHELYFPVAQPGAPIVNELLGVDVWSNLDGMLETYKGMHGLNDLFSGRPTASIWTQAPGQWVEW